MPAPRRNPRWKPIVRRAPTVRRAACALVAPLLLIACDDGTAPRLSSFDRIQLEIFDPGCIACHAAGQAPATQSGLVLTAGEAWTALVGAMPTLPTARDDGLLRVMPGNPDRSLLFQKLIGWAAADPSAWPYGSPMPLGGPPPSLGQVEFVRQWILSGADRTGVHVDPALLEDATPLEPGEYVPLAAPERGYQLSVGPFVVQPHFERELFVYRRVGNPEPIYVNRIEVKMRINSHHFLLYDFAHDTPPSVIPPHDVLRDIRNPDGSLHFGNMLAMGYHVFVGGSMTPYNEIAFPDGVAFLLPADASLDLNSHYVNRTDLPLFGEAQANLHTIDEAEVEHLARTLALSNFSISLPPGQRTTLTRTFHVAEPMRIILLTSHMHQRGETFVIRIAGGPRDGEVVYRSEDWESPPIEVYDPPLELAAGEGLTSEITWFNETGRTITFGLTSEDEMGIIFGYWY